MNKTQKTLTDLTVKWSIHTKHSQQTASTHHKKTKPNRFGAMKKKKKKNKRFQIPTEHTKQRNTTSKFWLLSPSGPKNPRLRSNKMPAIVRIGCRPSWFSFFLTAKRFSNPSFPPRSTSHFEPNKKNKDSKSLTRNRKSGNDKHIYCKICIVLERTDSSNNVTLLLLVLKTVNAQTSYQILLMTTLDEASTSYLHPKA